MNNNHTTKVHPKWIAVQWRAELNSSVECQSTQEPQNKKTWIQLGFSLCSQTQCQVRLICVRVERFSSLGFNLPECESVDLCRLGLDKMERIEENGKNSVVAVDTISMQLLPPPPPASTFNNSIRRTTLIYSTPLQQLHTQHSFRPPALIPWFPTATCTKYTRNLLAIDCREWENIYIFFFRVPMSEMKSVNMQPGKQDTSVWE